MPAPMIAIAPEEEDAYRTASGKSPHDVLAVAKPLSGLAVAQDGSLASPTGSPGLNVSCDDVARQEFDLAAATGTSVESASEVPEVISEEDEETNSEGEPLTPSDSSYYIFAHQQTASLVSSNGTPSDRSVVAAAAAAATAADARSGGQVAAAAASKRERLMSSDGRAHGRLSQQFKKLDLSGITSSSRTAHQSDSHDDSTATQSPSTPTVRSPRASQFFSNPFSSSAGSIPRTSSSTKVSRHTSFKGFFRRNSSALSSGHLDGVSSSHIHYHLQRHLQPQPADSPASSVAMESVASRSPASGPNPHEPRFRFGLKRRPSPPIHGGVSQLSDTIRSDAARRPSNTTPSSTSTMHLHEHRVSHETRGGTWPILPSESYSSHHDDHTPPNGPSPQYTLNGTVVTPSSSAQSKDRSVHSHPSVHLSHIKARSKIFFGNLPKPLEHRRTPTVSEVHNQPPRPGFSIPAASGVGLKARRMSASLPDSFNVDTCELDDEYVSASKLPGKRGKALGKGATATVKVMARKGHKKNDPLYAVKEFRKCGQHEDKQEYIKKVKSEYSIAASLHHPNIVCTYKLCTHNGRFNHVMEMCGYGELFTLVQKNYLGVQDNLCFFKQVVRGVGYLHANGIAHRDIKLENLLLTEEGHVKISDFGVSEVFSGIHPGLREAYGECGIGMKDVRLCQPGICGSMPYISPEVLAKKGPYDPRPLDVWSCAIVMITLACHGNPWQAAEPNDPNYRTFVAAWDRFLQAHPDGQITEQAAPRCGPIFSHISQQYSPGLRRLLLAMLNPNPDRRIPITAVLADNYFKSIECCCPESQDEECIVIDAAGKGSTKKACRMNVQKVHHHAPPERKLLPQHRFDMGDGWS